MPEPDGKPRRDKRDLAPTPVGVPTHTGLVLVPELDEHLSALSTLFHQYLKHYWLAAASSALADAAKEGHTQALAYMHLVAKRIALLGGVPACHSIDQVNFSYLEHEPEGAYEVEEMLERDLLFERDLARRTALTAEYASELGDKESEAVLLSLQRAAEKRVDRLAKLLHDGDGA